MEFRKATLNDLDKIIEFYLKTAKFEQTVSKVIGLWWILDENFKAWLAKEVLLSDFLYLFAIENNEIIWFICGYLKDKNNWWTYNQIAYIDHIFVEENFRWKWIWKKLIREFESWAKEKLADLVTIEVLPENENAIKLYKNLWFSDHLLHFKKEL